MSLKTYIKSKGWKNYKISPVDVDVIELKALAAAYSNSLRDARDKFKRYIAELNQVGIFEDKNNNWVQVKECL